MVVRLAADDAATPAAFWSTIRSGGLVVYPTGTLYGLGADVFNASAIKRLQAIKGRKGPFSVLVGSLDQLQHYALVSQPVAGKLVDMVPGPYTVILKPAPAAAFPAALMGRGGMVGFRLDDHPFLRRAFEQEAGVVTSSSVNRAGRTPLRRPDEILDQFGERIDLLVDAGTLKRSQGSTVIDVTTTPWTVLRSGDGQL